jgi:hypothetical protein
MFAVSASILTGLCVWNSIHAVTTEIKQMLGTSINFRLSSIVIQDPSSNGKYLKLKFEDSYRTYDGPDFNWDTVHQILEQVDGITDNNMELFQYVYVDDISLVPGFTIIFLQMRMTFNNRLNYWISLPSMDMRRSESRM